MAPNNGAAPCEFGARRQSPEGFPATKPVLLVSNQFLIRDGLKHIIESLESDSEIMELETLGDLYRQLGRSRDLAFVILDLAVPKLSQPDVLRNVCDRCIRIPVVAIGDSTTRSEVIAILDCGVDSYVPKSLDRERTRGAFRTITSGSEYLPLSFLFSRNEQEDVDPGPTNAPTRSNRRTTMLTPREVSVLKLVARGLTNDQIADDLGVRSSTVKVHVKNLRQKLGATNRTQAVVIAQRQNLIGFPDTVRNFADAGRRDSE